MSTFERGNTRKKPSWLRFCPRSIQGYYYFDSMLTTEWMMPPPPPPISVYYFVTKTFVLTHCSYCMNCLVADLSQLDTNPLKLYLSSCIFPRKNIILITYFEVLLFDICTCSIIRHRIFFFALGIYGWRFVRVCTDSFNVFQKTIG